MNTSSKPRTSRSAIEELSQGRLDEKCRTCVAVATDDPERAMRVISGSLSARNLKIDFDGTVLVFGCNDRVAEIPLALASAGVSVTGMEQRGGSLEDYFLTRIGGK